MPCPNKEMQLDPSLTVSHAPRCWSESDTNPNVSKIQQIHGSSYIFRKSKQNWQLFPLFFSGNHKSMWGGVFHTHTHIVAKKRDPGILDPELFLAQIRKVEARLGKLANIRKIETDEESSSKRLGK